MQVITCKPRFLSSASDETAVIRLKRQFIFRKTDITKNPKNAIFWIQYRNFIIKQSDFMNELFCNHKKLFACRIIPVSVLVEPFARVICFKVFKLSLIHISEPTRQAEISY